MTYTQLKYFSTACKYNNISRAAEKLYVSQPSVSLAIKELEEELGEALFLRSNNKLFLTEAGRMLWEMSESMLAQMELITDSITKRHMDNESMVIGIIGEIANWVLPYVDNVLQPLRSKYPNLDVEMVQLNPTELDKLVANHIVDIAFCNGSTSLPAGIGKKLITRAELKVMMSEDNPLAAHEKIKPSMLRDVTLIGDYIDQEHWKEWLTKFFDGEDFVPKTRYFFTQNEPVCWLLKNRKVVSLGRPVINGVNMDGMAVRPFDPPKYEDVIAVYDNRYTIRNVVADFIQAADRVPDPEQ